MPEDLPSSREIDWETIVRKAWGDEWLKKEVVYEFPPTRKFYSTDSTDSGIYSGS